MSRSYKGPYNRSARFEPKISYTGREVWEDEMCEPEPCIGCGKMIRWHKEPNRNGTAVFTCFDYPRCRRLKAV